MPLIRIDSISRGVSLGLWQMTESTGVLPVPPVDDFSGVHSDFRLREKLTEYCLLKAMTGRDDILIGHHPSGEPFIPGCNISISHTRGWAAMMLSETRRVGVDIEYRSDRVNKVAERFIRPDEQNDTTERRLVNWSAKEAVYKLFSDENLGYFEMRLHSFQVSGNGTVDVDDMKGGSLVPVSFVLNDDYVLTYCWM